MTGPEIIEYAQRQGYRVVVTEDMVWRAIGRIVWASFTVVDVVNEIPRDAQGSTVSEYLVALWLAELVRLKRILPTRRRFPARYRCLPTDLRSAR